MTKEDTIAVGAGVLSTFSDLLGNSFIESAIKGLIGGVTAYLGKVLIVWIIKKVIELFKKQKQQKANNQNKTK